jgi:hypothetical protein
MAQTFIDGTNIDTSLFSYSSPKAHASGGKVVNLYNKMTKESLSIATPLILTWGAQEGKDQQGNSTGKWTLSLQFPNSEFPNKDCEDFLASMRALEAKVKKDAMTYSKEWFGKVITSPDVMDEKFNVMLRHPKIKGTIEPDVSKAPTLTVKIPQWSGVWKPEIYDEDSNPLYINGKVNSHLTPLEFLKPKSHVMCIIQCGGLWFVNGKVSITWNLKQAMVQKPKASMEGVCLLKPKASDKALLKSQPPPEEIDNEGPTAIVDDSDDENEPETWTKLPVANEEKVEVVKEPEPIHEESVVEEPEKPVVAETQEKPKKKPIVKKKTSTGEN